MDHILVVEDNHLFGTVVCKMIRQQLSCKLTWVENYADARKKIEDRSNNFSVALLDLNLPDAEMGEAVDYAIAHDIPSIVFTSRFNQQLHEQIWSKGIVDYVLKEGPDSLNYIIKQIRRLHRNRSIDVLVVEDSALIRNHLVETLRVQRFNVFSATNGEEALSVISNNSNIRLVITDFHMPIMDGFDLVRKLRRQYSYNDLAIIGLSAHEDPTLSARFLKYGANDYLVKPFSQEEFYCRVHQNVDMLESIRQIRQNAERDFLTGLYNRRYFFNYWQKTLNPNKPTAFAMLDIDHFKQVNDTYGHDSGDQVLREVSALLIREAPADALVARFGGEEFCLLFNADKEEGTRVAEHLRETISRQKIPVEGQQQLQVTTSIGLYCGNCAEIEKIIRCADEKLYLAKQLGRNCVIATTTIEGEELHDQ
ncbi:MAG: diguanylate cyclase response regulator [Desulfuromonas sp.]|nr:MAG: diguanylate cyclase response regulator [Desulfuromonas sp.]